MEGPIWRVVVLKGPLSTSMLVWRSVGLVWFRVWRGSGFGFGVGLDRAQDPEVCRPRQNFGKLMCLCHVLGVTVETVDSFCRTVETVEPGMYSCPSAQRIAACQKPEALSCFPQASCAL